MAQLIAGSIEPTFVGHQGAYFATERVGEVPRRSGRAATARRSRARMLAGEILFPLAVAKTGSSGLVCPPRIARAAIGPTKYWGRIRVQSSSASTS